MNVLYMKCYNYTKLTECYMKCHNICGISVNAYERVVVVVAARLSRPHRAVAVLGSSIRFPTHAVWHRVHVERAARLLQLAALYIIMAKHVVQLVSEIMPSAETNNISK